MAPKGYDKYGQAFLDAIEGKFEFLAEVDLLCFTHCIMCYVNKGELDVLFPIGTVVVETACCGFDSDIEKTFQRLNPRTKFIFFRGPQEEYKSNLVDMPLRAPATGFIEAPDYKERIASKIADKLCEAGVLRKKE
ncbi:MAG TPA: hypothetical protein VI953_04310 [Candidatus Paceibacterota bacterium]